MLLLKFLSALSTLSVCLTIAGVAQTSTGGIQGKVVDAQGAVVQSVEITVAGSDTQRVHKASTNNRGIYRVDGLEAGTYDVRANAAGFAEGKVQAPVHVGETASVDFELKPAGTTENVVVRESVADRTSSVLSNPVTDHEIENTPLANRSFANIAYIAPMTAPVEPSDPTKARITAVSFAGSSGLNVDLSVDGGDNNDDYIGGFLQNYSPEAVREFNVRTAQFGADTSRTNGGSIIISTKSGSE